MPQTLTKEEYARLLLDGQRVDPRRNPYYGSTWLPMRPSMTLADEAGEIEAQYADLLRQEAASAERARRIQKIRDYPTPGWAYDYDVAPQFAAVREALATAADLFAPDPAGDLPMMPVAGTIGRMGKAIGRGEIQDALVRVGAASRELPPLARRAYSEGELYRRHALGRGLDPEDRMTSYIVDPEEIGIVNPGFWRWDEDSAPAFFELGKTGVSLDDVRPVTGWRYGRAPEELVSRNFVDGTREGGLSLAGLVGENGELSLGWMPHAAARQEALRAPIFMYHGWIRPGRSGSDGEPLMLAPLEVGKLSYRYGLRRLEEAMGMR